MTMFQEYPRYNRYRTLALLTPTMRGEDVYALQSALESHGVGLLDGVFGPQTRRAVVGAQRVLGLQDDGLAGGATQRGLALSLGEQERVKRALPRGLLRGQMELESGFRLGNYSAMRDDGSYDAGVTQRNTKYTRPSEGFHVRGSIYFLAKTLRDSYNRYVDEPDERRRWALAAGSWNAPAYANYLAGVYPSSVPSGKARAALENYMALATVYLEE